MQTGPYAKIMYTMILSHHNKHPSMDSHIYYGTSTQSQLSDDEPSDGISLQYFEELTSEDDAENAELPSKDKKPPAPRPLQDQLSENTPDTGLQYLQLESPQRDEAESRGLDLLQDLHSEEEVDSDDSQHNDHQPLNAGHTSKHAARPELYSGHAELEAETLEVFEDPKFQETTSSPADGRDGTQRGSGAHLLNEKAPTQEAEWVQSQTPELEDILVIELDSEDEIENLEEQNSVGEATPEMGESDSHTSDPELSGPNVNGSGLNDLNANARETGWRFEHSSNFNKKSLHYATNLKPIGIGPDDDEKTDHEYGEGHGLPLGPDVDSETKSDISDPDSDSGDQSLLRGLSHEPMDTDEMPAGPQIKGDVWLKTPIIISITGDQLLLIPHYNDSSVKEMISLFSVEEVASCTLRDIFQLLRNGDLIDAYSFHAEDELRFDIPQMNLSVTEDNIYARDIKLWELIQTFDQLRQSEATALTIHLSTQKRFISQFRLITRYRDSGKSLADLRSELSTTDTSPLDSDVPMKKRKFS